jgi:UDP-N-acetylglucosamine 2-epimerase (non-hydrolysing)
VATKKPETQQPETRNEKLPTMDHRPSTKMKIMLVAGARPNFMKIASIIDAIKMHNDSIENSRFNIQHLLVHTGQHYDSTMSEAFFRDLDLPKAGIYLEVGSGSHAIQTAEIMKRFEPVLLDHQPDVVIVVGDVNSTVACALVASKIQYDGSTQNSKLITHNSGVKRPLVAHVEAGLRSFDRTMPEEINRLLTDAIADFLFTTEESADQNLLQEGIPKSKIFFVGNTMIDTLLKYREIAQKSNILNKLSLSTKNQQPATSNQILPYAVLTLHRPSNVDRKRTFRNILEALKEVAKHLPVILPAHPRTLNRIKEFGFENYFDFPSQPLTLSPQSKAARPNSTRLQPRSSEEVCSLASNLQPLACGLHCVEPLGYLDFLCLMSNSKLVLTDSGGMQEETTILGIPCITLRENTERPVTINFGTNILAGVQKEQIISASLSALRKDDFVSPNAASNTQHSMLSTQHSFGPPLWDGQAGQRIIQILVDSSFKS